MTAALANARLQWDADGVPHSLDYGDVYYSRADALGESSHVFIDGNQLPRRFATSGDRFIVGELGFGAGLNFLNCCRAFCHSAPAGATLHYVACELHPFTLEDMQRWLARFDELALWRDQLLQHYPDHTAGVHQLALRLPRHNIRLTLLYGDAIQLLGAYGHHCDLRMDAWFLDGFSPKLNPALWQTTVVQQIARLSHAATTLSSYSVSTTLRQALTACGFRFEKREGFAGKRHMLTAQYERGTTTNTATPVRHALVIGGGLSGCSTAFALAESGWQVTLLESSATLASQGSGNLQAVLHCKPGTADTIDNHFNLHAYLFAQRHYSALAAQGLPWHQCGMLHVAIDADQVKRFARIVQCGRFHSRILQPVDASAAGALAGVPLRHGGLYFPLSGWLTPSILCEFYVRHAGIEVRTNAAAQTLTRHHAGWRVTLADGTVIDASHVVLCNAADAYAFTQCRQLPLIGNRGQVDIYAGSAATGVRTILCGQGYLTPITNGLQSLGGSYYVEHTSTEQNRQTHLTLLSRMDPQLADDMAQRRPLQQRVGQRCQTPDRMPLAGLVSPQYPGLYINAAHGSNGLARTPVSAALLASVMNGTPSPLDDAMCRLVAPDRFAQAE